MNRKLGLSSPPKPVFDSPDRMSNPYRSTIKPVSIESIVGECASGAAGDYQIGAEYIYTYRGSQQTFMQYRRVVELYLAWTWLIHGKPLGESHRQDVEQFLEFCMKPPESWVGKTRQARFVQDGGSRVPNPKWKPFFSGNRKGGARNATLDTCFKVLGSFFGYLAEEEYIPRSPMTGMRQRSKFLRSQQNARRPRTLSTDQWNCVLETAERMADSEPQNHERTLFMLSAMFCMYLRISEFTGSARWQPAMGHFFKDSHGRWWFNTVSKGNKERNVAVCGDMLKALKRYRRSRKLPALPMPGESAALVHCNKRAGSIGKTRIRQLCKEVFMEAARSMRIANRAEDANTLESITPHWLRHTGISFDVPHRPLHHIRDDAGHSSIKTTNSYIEVALAERHSSGVQKPIRMVLGLSGDGSHV